MRLDTYAGTDIAKAAETAIEAEAMGFARLWTVDAGHDPFLPLALAASVTRDIELATGIAVAFARNPVTVAETARDLQELSQGRLFLGLGSQVKAHITRRYSMPWSQPAARMREFVLAMRAIWHAWDTGEPLDFQGDFTSHTLMTPTFSGGPSPYGHPKVLLAGVGPLMTEVAGEVADGLICHRFVTAEFLRQVTLPALARGAAKAGKTLADLEVSGSFLVVSGTTDEEVAIARRSVRQQIAFYGSTAAYTHVLDLHGWGDLHQELRRLSQAGRWEEMADLVDDEVLDAFAVTAEPEAIVDALAERFGGLVQRTALTMPEHTDPERWRALLASVRLQAA